MVSQIFHLRCAWLYWWNQVSSPTKHFLSRKRLWNDWCWFWYDRLYGCHRFQPRNDRYHCHPRKVSKLVSTLPRKSKLLNYPKWLSLSPLVGMAATLTDIHRCSCPWCNKIFASRWDFKTFLEIRNFLIREMRFKKVYEKDFCHMVGKL